MREIAISADWLNTQLFLVLPMCLRKWMYSSAWPRSIKLGASLPKQSACFQMPSFCLKPYRASISPWDKKKTFSVTCQAYLTWCLHFSTALWSVCYKALAPQASFLVLKQDKFILYRQPLYLLFLLLGTPASLMLKIYSWGRMLLIRSLNCIPLLNPGLSLSHCSVSVL